MLRVCSATKCSPSIRPTLPIGVDVSTPRIFMLGDRYVLSEDWNYLFGSSLVYTRILANHSVSPATFSGQIG
jgi:hypothetical protein